MRNRAFTRDAAAPLYRSRMVAPRASVSGRQGRKQVAVSRVTPCGAALPVGTAAPQRPCSGHKESGDARYPDHRGDAGSARPGLDWAQKGRIAPPAGGAKALARPAFHRVAISKRQRVRCAFRKLVYGDDDKDEGGDADQNNQQIPIAEVTGGKLVLRSGGARRQLCQLLIT